MSLPSKKHSRSPDEQMKMKKEDSKLEITYNVLFYIQLQQEKRKHKRNQN